MDQIQITNLLTCTLITDSKLINDNETRLTKLIIASNTSIARTNIISNTGTGIQLATVDSQ